MANQTILSKELNPIGSSLSKGEGKCLRQMGEDACSDSISPPTCTLTSPELKARKATVIASLQKQLLEKKELPDGYAFRFAGTDSVVDELTDFIKTERECCSFFTFDLSVKGDKSTAWLKLTGPEGSKEFIITELGF